MSRRRLVRLRGMFFYARPQPRGRLSDEGVDVRRQGRRRSSPLTTRSGLVNGTFAESQRRQARRVGSQRRREQGLRRSHGVQRQALHAHREPGRRSPHPAEDQGPPQYLLHHLGADQDRGLDRRGQPHDGHGRRRRPELPEPGPGQDQGLEASRGELLQRRELRGEHYHRHVGGARRARCGSRTSGSSPPGSSTSSAATTSR